MTNISSGMRRLLALTIASLLAVVALVGTATDVGGATPHYQAMADRSSSLKCDDFKYATSRGLIDPVEVLWLLDTHPQPLFCADIINRPDFIQTNRTYYVMLAEAAKGQLTCDDIRWNSRYGLVHYDQAGDLLSRVPGCQLDDYEFLVVLAYGERPSPNLFRFVTENGVLGCSDVNFRVTRGLITAEQAGWLRGIFTSRDVVCGPPTPAPAGAVQPPTGKELVDYQIIPGGGCWADSGKYGYASDATLLDCEQRTFSNLNFYYPWRWGVPGSVGG